MPITISNIVFYALGNIGDSKKTDYTRAYDPDDMNEFTIEISDNTKNNATFQTGIENLGDGQYRMETFKLIKTLDTDGEVILTPVAYTPVRNHILNIPESILDEYWNAQGEIVTENNTGNPEYDGNEFGYLNMRRWCLENEAFDGDNSFEPRYACCGDYRDGKLVNDTSGRGKAQVKVNNDVWRAFYKWVITSTDDEFKNELDQWCVRSAVEFFYAFTHIYTMMDNRAKNTFWHFAKTGVYHEVSKPVTELLHIYCELVDGEYITTSDTEIHSDKTYYTQYAFDLWDYDNDTAIGINNNGELVFPYGREDTDYNIEGNPSSGYVFNGATSAFWCRLRNLLSPEISDTFKNVQKECFSANHLIKEFDAFQECYPEEIWRLDVQRKYIRTFTGESIDNSKPKHDVQYLRDMMQGRKKYQRRQWVRDQEIYFGTKHELSTVINNENQITFRCYTPGGDDVVIQPNYTLKITPFSDMYLVLEYSNSDKRTKNPPIRAKAGVEQEVLCPLSNMDDTMVAIYCANRIQALGDLSACYIAANNFSMATKLKKLVLGNSTPGYNNARLTSLSLGNNTLLEELDITNCQNLSGAMDFNQYNNLTTFLAEGTSITSVVFAPSGKIKTAYLPKTVNTLEMQNLDKLTDFKASLDYLEKLTLRGGIINHRELLDKCIDTLRELYLYDINWTGVNSLPNTDLLNQLLSLFSSKITGFVYIDNEVHNRELVAYAKTWRDLEVRSASIIPQFEVRFVDWDGRLINSQVVDRDESAFDPTSKSVEEGGCGQLVRDADGRYTYVYKSWDREFANITSDMVNEGTNTIVVTAQYTATPIPYTLTFDSNGGSEVPAVTQGYGTQITIDDPIMTGYSFKGWAPELPATIPDQNMHFIAQWQINQYNITFDTGGGTSIPTITQDYNTDITSPADPTREGYTFSGWDKEIPSKMPATDMTINAKWSINYYKVRFINGSNVLSTLSIPYGSDAVYSGETPEWTRGIGSFAGWQPDGKTIKTDTDCYAQFSGTEIPSSVKSLNNCSWNEIQVLAKFGSLNGSRQWCCDGKVWFNIGDEKNIVCTDGEAITLQIWDFNHDDKVSGGKAAFTFGMKGLTGYNVYTNRINNGYGGSVFRDTLLPLYLDKMPADLKKCVVTVYKKWRDNVSQNVFSNHEEKLFLPAAIEVDSTCTRNTEEGTTYPIFVDDNSRVKLSSYPGYKIRDKGNDWPLRSVSKKGKYNDPRAAYVWGTGKVEWNEFSASNNDPFCFVFCI